MLSQETSMGALGGKAEVVKPGEKMGGQARKDFQGSHSYSELGLWTPAHACCTLRGLDSEKKGAARGGKEGEEERSAT